MPKTTENWGRNVRFAPKEVFKPRTEAELLAVLNEHPRRSIRVLGAKYSWSEVVACYDVLIDLSDLPLANSVRVHHDASGKAWAEIGACGRVDQVLRELDRQGGYTLPAYGILGALSIAGSVATATHGSGRASMAHFVTGVRAAAYDPTTGEAKIYEWKDGDELQAARCALGCMGIVLSLRFDLEPRFLLEEQVQKCSSIDEVLARQDDYPLQQFYLVPWSWRWLVQRRRRADEGRKSSWLASGYRWYRYLVVELGFHWLLKLLAARRYPGRRMAISALYRWVFPMITLSFLKKGLKVTDRAERLLTLRHDLVRHLEMELFVPAEQLRDAANFVEEVLRYCGGKLPEVSEPVSQRLKQSDGEEELKRLRNSYVHDYLITFRYVLADDTLISMTGGDNGDKKARYAISLITYDNDPYPFLAVCRFLAIAMARFFDARPHWGKICPLDAGELERLYPRLGQFREHCKAVDPQGVFQNEFTRQKLGR